MEISVENNQDVQVIHEDQKIKLLSSIDKGDTANGSGLRFPLVISTSIKAKALIGIKIIKNKIIKFFFIFLS